MTDLKSHVTSASTRPWLLDPGRAPDWARDVDAVFLDYDGTLTPIVDRPERATLSEPVRVALRRLAVRRPVTIVSGRDLEDVRRLVAVEELGYVGSHGLDITGPRSGGPRKEVGVACLPDLDDAEAALRDGTAGIDGVLVERKRFSISTHVRRVRSDDHPRVKRIVERVRRAHPTLRREGGKMLFELRPDVPWDKGAAIRWLLAEMAIAVSRTLYVGDDLTDETAFVALGPEATTVIVAADAVTRPTAARFRVRGPDEVETMLARLGDVD